jgi:hypothetical protein
MLEQQYAIGSSKKRIAVRLGFPKAAEKGDSWTCSFQVTGLKDNRVKIAHGEDGLQAIMLAATAIRKQLDRVKSVMSSTEPYEFVFPRFVPMSYGLEFHHKLCNLLNVAIEKREKQLSKARLSRRKRQ